MLPTSEPHHTPAAANMERFRRPGETLEQLYARSVREVQKWRKRRRWTLGISWGAFILGQLSTATPMSWVKLAPAIPAASLFLIVSSLLGLLVGMLMRPSNRNALNSLLETDDVRAIGPLLEAMQMMIPAITGRAAGALIRLLHNVRGEHAELLTPLQRRYLRSLIAGDAPKRASNSAVATAVHLSGALNLVPVDAVKASISPFTANKFMGFRSEALSVAVVEALAYIGDSADLELIQRIAANPVQQAALRASSLLESRIKPPEGAELNLRVAATTSDEPPLSAHFSTKPPDPNTPGIPAREEPQVQSTSA